MIERAVRFSIADNDTGAWRERVIDMSPAEIAFLREQRDPIAFLCRAWGDGFEGLAIVWEIVGP